MRSYTPFVTAGGRERRVVALTFDDGPGPYTPRVLGVLRRAHAAATFFEIGFMIDYFHGATVAARRDGFAIGDHTETHPFMGRLPASLQRRELIAQAEHLRRYHAGFPRLFRPPYGSFDATTFALLHRLRMLMVLWTVDTGDYTRPGVQAIVDRALSGARPGAIILLHDAGGNRTETIAALPRIIRGLRACGYRLVTVPQMMLDDPPPHHQRLPTALAGG